MRISADPSNLPAPIGQGKMTFGQFYMMLTDFAVKLAAEGHGIDEIRKLQITFETPEYCHELITWPPAIEQSDADDGTDRGVRIAIHIE